MTQCTAIAKNGRINLVVDKKDEGYKAFSEVLTAIEKRGCMSWYGDIEDEKGKEKCGLVITSKLVGLKKK